MVCPLLFRRDVERMQTPTPAVEIRLNGGGLPPVSVKLGLPHSDPEYPLIAAAVTETLVRCRDKHPCAAPICVRGLAIAHRPTETLGIVVTPRGAPLAC